MAIPEIKHIKPNHSTKPQLFLHLHSRPSAAWLCWPFLGDGARVCPPCLGMFGSSENIWPCNKATANIGRYSLSLFSSEKFRKCIFWGGTFLTRLTMIISLLCQSIFSHSMVVFQNGRSPVVTIGLPRHGRHHGTG